MEQELNNTASAVGNYNEIPTSITSSVSVVTMISGLTITKTADKQNWADGELTYTIVIDNKTDKSYVSPKITDILDINLVTFVDKSVFIDDVLTTNYTYEESSGTLTITLEDITASSSKTIKFKVIKKS